MTLDPKALEAAASAVTDADNEPCPEGAIDHPNVSSWSEHVARRCIKAYLEAAGLVEVPVIGEEE